MNMCPFVQRNSAIFILFIILSLDSFGQAPMNWQFSEVDNGRIIEIRLHDTIEIRLDGNLTTGYEWDIADINSDFLIKKKQDYLPGGAIGAGGITLLQFESKNAGKTALKLIYHRSFQPNEPILRTFEITLNIK